MGLTILMIEDNPDDVFFLEKGIKKAGDETMRLAVTGTLQNGLDRLDQERFDIVLLDLSLPDARGLEALKAIVAKNKNIPVVIMSSIEDDQTVLDAVSMGAQDYLIKKDIINPQMIFWVVHHAIERHRLFQEVERDRLSLQESEERFRTLFEANVDGIVVLDINGSILFVNPSAESLLGRFSPELTGEPFGFPIDTDRPVELDILRPDGTSVIVEMRIISTKWMGKNVFLASLRDITERLKNEAARIETEKRYRALFDRSLDCVYIHDLKGNFIDANDATLRLLGYDQKDISSLNLISLLTEDQVPQALDTLKEIKINGRQAHPSEYMIRQKNGNKRMVESLGSVLYKEEKPYAIQGIARDVTERNAMQTRQLLTTIVLNILNSSSKWRTKLRDITQAIKKSLQIESVGIRIQDGERYPFVEAQGYPIHIINAKSGTLHLGSEEKIQQDSDNGPSPECLCGKMLSNAVDPTWNFVTAFGSFWFNDVTELSKSGIKFRPQCCCAGYQSRIFVPLKDGDEILGILQIADSRPNRFDLKDILCLENLAVNIVITCSRVRSEQLLTKSKKRYRNLFQYAPVMFFSVNGENRIIQVNDKMSQVLGYEPGELIGKNAFAFLTPESRQNFEKKAFSLLISQKAISGVHHKAIKKNGKMIDVKISASAETDQYDNFTGALIAMEDITEQVQMETYARQAQKMEAIGTLAGGIAHDFNNILSAILGYTELALDSIPQNSILYENLQEILSGCNRAAELVKQILTFSRKGEQKMEVILITPVIKEAIKLLRASIPTYIEIRQNISDDLPPVLADPTQIHQIIINLCTNANHAMEESGGILSINLTQEFYDGHQTFSNKKIPAGNYLRLSVADTGSGISESDIHRIFDPYFTTKSQNKGTGLGLSMVLGIVEIHGGQIFCKSELGRGTKFDILLPTAKKEINTGVDSALLEISGGIEHVLIVDDEKTIAKSLYRLLKSIGYQAHYETSSIDAFELFLSNPEQFDIIISDITMPMMTGDRLAREIKKIRPDIPCILCTGFSEKLSEQEAYSMGIEAFLMKPINRSTLTQTVRNLLDSKKKISRPQVPSL